MLHAVSQLAEDPVRDVLRILGHEENPDALGSDQADDLFDLLEQCGRSIGEQQMRFVEEENELRHRQVTRFGQVLEQFRQHPEQQRGVGLRRLEQPFRRQDVDHATARRVGLEKVREVERGFAEELRPALPFQRQQPALNRTDARRRNVPVCDRELRCVLADELDHRAEVLEVEQQHSLLIRHAEHDVEHARLGFIELQLAGQKQWSHFGDRRADRMTGLAIDIPERNGARGESRFLKAELPEPFAHLGRLPSGLADAGEVAFHIRHENRHAQFAETLRQRLQRDGLAGAGRSRDEPVAIRHGRQQMDFVGALGDEDRVGHARRIGQRGPVGNAGRRAVAR